MNIGLIGCGYWGSKWARVLGENGLLRWICDPDHRAAREYCERYAADYQNPEAITKKLPHWEQVDAVVIASPPSTHYRWTMEAIRAHVHVLLEKPVTLDAAQAHELHEAAQSTGTVLMPGHTFLFTPEMAALRGLLRELPPPAYVRAVWTNDGIVRRDVDVWWNVAPHPISLLREICGAELPGQVESQSMTFLEQGRYDAVQATLQYQDGPTAQIYVSWIDPTKRRELTILFEDQSKIYIDFGQHVFRYAPPGADPSPIPLRKWEPLTAEIGHFMGCITGTHPGLLSPSSGGVHNVSMLQFLVEHSDLYAATTRRVS